MRLDQIVAAAADHVVGRLLRRVLLLLLMAGCAIVALYHFTVAGNMSLAGQYGDLYARLIVGGIYAALALILFGVAWAIKGRPTKIAPAPALAGQREMQLVMLVEAVMLGYTLAKKRQRVG